MCGGKSLNDRCALYGHVNKVGMQHDYLLDPKFVLQMCGGKSLNDRCALYGHVNKVGMQHDYLLEFIGILIILPNSGLEATLFISIGFYQWDNSETTAFNAAFQLVMMSSCCEALDIFDAANVIG